MNSVTAGSYVASTTVIVGAYEKETKGTVVTHRVQVGDSILIETKNNVQSTLFLIKDHLGSLVTVVDSLGTIKERLSYDLWGKKTSPNRRNIPFDIEATALLAAFVHPNHIVYYAHGVYSFAA